MYDMRYELFNVAQNLQFDVHSICMTLAEVGVSQKQECSTVVVQTVAMPNLYLGVPTKLLEIIARNFNKFLYR